MRYRRSLTGEIIAERERWLIRLRWMAVAGMFGITSIARWVFGLGLAVGPIFALAGLVASYNALLWVWMRRRGRSRPVPLAAGELRVMTNVQISLDLLVLTFVIHFAGGITNPLGAFMVFHMAIASILLPRRDAYCQAAWAAALYIALGVIELLVPAWHRPLVGYMASANEPPETVFAHPLFVLGECGVLVVTLLLIVYFTSDIAGRLREVYRRLTEANEELAKLEQTKSRFLNVAGHQIRTPLAAMYSLLEGVQMSGDELTPTHRDLLDRVMHRASGLMVLVKEMLTLSAVKEDIRRSEQIKPVNLREALEAVVHLHAEAARAAGVNLTADCGEDVQVGAWPAALQDVFGNLLSNAVKYTPAGGNVDLSASRHGRRAVVIVADTGIGIPAAAQADLFSEFFRAGNARQFAEGTGLGLTIVKETVDRLGGRLMLCSDESSGTMVQVELPVME